MDFKIFLICAVTSFVIVETSEETPEFDNVTVFVCNVNRCDWRTLAGAIGVIKNQHPCEACWAFSIISVLVLETFRFRFLSTDEEPLSEQHLLDYGLKFNRLLGRCDSTPGIIEGGDTIAAFGIIRKFGTYRTIDYPWTGKNQDPQPTKGDPAMSGFEYVPHVVRNVENGRMKQLIIDNGPVSAYMYAPDDMEHFKGRGIYTCTSSGKANHAITVIGFGQQGGTPYWLIRNSWGKNVGDKGYYKIRMTDNGIEDCGIRQKVVWVVRRNEIETVNKTMVIETI